MSMLWTILAVLLAAVVLWDQFVTVFSTSGAGPLTRFGSKQLWNALLFIHRRHRMHRVLAFAGPFMMLLSIVLWYLLFGLAVYMLFAAHTGSVINNTTDESATHLETLYFVSTTISSLGYGDWVPSRFPWTLIGTLATLLATIVLTVSLSYVLSVISAAIERRSLASGVFSIGDNIPDLIKHLQFGNPQASLKNYLLGLSSTIDKVALQHLAYPVLKYFHASRRDLSPTRAVLLLSDTLFLLDASEQQVPSGVMAVVQSSIDNFSEFSSSNIASVDESDTMPEYLARQAEDMGLETAALERAFAAYAPRRCRLLALRNEDGWFADD